MLYAGVAYDDLHVAGEVVRREWTVGAKQGMRRVRHGDEAHVHQEIAEEPRRHTRRHDHVGARFRDRLLRAREHRVGKLHLGARATLLQLRDDLHQPFAGKGGIDHQVELRLPPLLQVARQALERVQVPQQHASAFEEGLAVGRQDCPPTLDRQQGDVQRLLQPRNGIAHGRLAAVQGLRRLSESPAIHHGRQHGPLFQSRLQLFTF
jgi:hypothetical protein